MMNLFRRKRPGRAAAGAGQPTRSGRGAHRAASSGGTLATKLRGPGRPTGRPEPSAAAGSRRSSWKPLPRPPRPCRPRRA